MSQHLIPNKAIYRNEMEITGQEEFDRYENQVMAEEAHVGRAYRPTNHNPLDDEGDYPKEGDTSYDSSNQDMGEKRRKQLNDLVLSLENELTEQLYSHKIFLEDINRIEEEKNFYYDRLRQIENFVSKKKDSLVKRQIVDILAWAPEDFLEKN